MKRSEGENEEKETVGLDWLKEEAKRQRREKVAWILLSVGLHLLHLQKGNQRNKYVHRRTSLHSSSINFEPFRLNFD